MRNDKNQVQTTSIAESWPLIAGKMFCFCLLLEILEIVYMVRSQVEKKSPYITIALTQLLKALWFFEQILAMCLFFVSSSTSVIMLHLIFVDIEHIIDLIR